MITLTDKIEKDIAVVEFTGKLNTSTSPEAEKYVNNIIAGENYKMAFDFEMLDMISSTGLRIILATGKKLAKKKGRLVICTPNFVVMDVLKMSGFSSMFDIYDSLEEGLDTFK